jgi:hypothetical protein
MKNTALSIRTRADSVKVFCHKEQVKKHPDRTGEHKKQ